MAERKTSQYLEDHPKLLKVAVTDVLRYVIALEALSAPTLSLDERRQRLLTLAPHAVVTIDDFFHWLQHHGALDNGYNEILYFLREIDVLSSSSLPFSLAYTLREVAHLTRTVSSLYGQPRLTPPA